MSRVDGPRAQSVTEQGEPDGWSPSAGWSVEVTPKGDTRLCAVVPHDTLGAVHRALVAAVSEPLSVLYRQQVDRREPRPEAAPARDHVALGLSLERVLGGLEAHGAVLWNDARAELWIRGAMGEQLVLDHDGVLFCYPDDLSFRDALEACGVPEAPIETLADRDYVKHWFHAEHDVHEDGLIADLGLVEVRPQR